MPSRRQASQRFHLEPLEARLLLSADGLGGIIPDPARQEVEIVVPWQEMEIRHDDGGIFGAAKGFEVLNLEAAGVPSPISAPQKARIISGLGDLKAWFDRWGDSPLMSQDLPLTAKSLDDMLDPGLIFQERVVNPLTNYLNSTGSPTTTGLNAAIAALSGSFAGLTFTITPNSAGGGISTGLNGDQFAFNLSFTATKTQSVPLNLSAGTLQTPVRVESGAMVNATAVFVFDAVFGIELSPDIAGGADFFIQLNDLRATGTVAMTGVNFGMELGFLDVQAQGASLNLTAQAQFPMLNPDSDAEEKITNEELISRPVTELVAPVTSGSVNVNAPLHMTGISGLNPAGATSLTLTGNPWNPASLTKTLAGPMAAALTDFRVSDPSVWLGAVTRVGQWVSSLAAKPEGLAREIPFATGTTFSQLLNLGGKFTQVLDALRVADPQPGQELFTFSTLQELSSQLSAALGQTAGSQGFVFDPATHKLSWNVLAAYHALANPVVSLGSLASGAVSGISAAATLSVDVQGNTGFTMVFDLSVLSASITGSNALPPNGALTAAAHLNIQRDQSAIVAVTIPGAPGNTTRAQLISQINAALTAANLTNVTASDEDGKLKLTYTSPGEGSLTVTAAAGDPARTQLGLAATSSASKSLTPHLVVKNVVLGATATLSAPNISAAAKYGFSMLNTTGSSVTGTATVSVAVRDPGNPTAPISTSQFDAFVAAPATYLAAPVLSGAGSVVLRNLTLQGTPVPGLAFGASPTLTFTLPNVFTPATASLAVNGIGNFDRLANVSAATISTAFSSAGGFLSTIAGSGALNLKLPGVNKSLAQLLNFSGALQPAITALTTNPPATLQALQNALQTAFAAAGSAIPGFSLVPAISMTGDCLQMHVNVRISRNVSQPFHLKLGDFGATGFNGALAPMVNAAANLTGTGTIDLALKFGLDLSNAASPRFFVDESSTLSAEARVAVTNLNFSIGVGPLNVQVVNGSATIGEIGNSNPARIVLGLSNSGGNKIYLDAFNASLLEFTSTAGVGKVTLPLRFNGNPIPGGGGSTLEVTVPLSGGAPTLVLPDLESLVTGADLFSATGLLTNGLNLLFDTALSSLKGRFGSLDIPFVGGKLGDAFNFITGLKNTFATLGSASSLADAQSRLFTALGSGGANILKNITGAPGVTQDDVIITPATSPGSPVDEVTMEFIIGKTETKSFNFDFGLDALPVEFSTNMTLNLSLAYEWRLKIGLNKTEGFFLVTSGVDELQATVSACLASGSNAQVEFGLLAGKLTAVDDTTCLTGTLDIDLTGGPHVTIGTLASSLGLDVDFDLDAHANLKLEAGLGLGSDIERFPHIQAMLVVDWPIAGTSGTGTPDVQITGLQMDAGEFIQNVLGRYISKIHGFFEPLDPIVDFLNTQLPVVDAKFIDVIAMMGSSGRAAATLVDIVTQVKDLYDAVQGFSGGGTLNMGTFDGGGIDWGNPNFDFGSFDFAGGLSGVGDLMASLGGMAGGITNGIVSVNIAGRGPNGSGTPSDPEGFKIPILQDPSMIFGMLFGQQATLVEYTMPSLDFNVSTEILLALIPLPPVPIPLSLKLFGEFAFHAQFTFGLDTYGLKQIIDGGGADSFFNGFYVLNKPGSEVTISAALGISASFDAFFIEAGVKGGIRGIIGLGLHEPANSNDGKLRWEEIEAQGLLCSIELTGSVNFFIDAFIEIGVSIFSIEIEINLVDIEIFSFTISCDGVPPNLASLAADGTLTLNTGSRANLRSPAIDDRTEEEYSIEPGKLPGSVHVSAFGFTETYGPGGIGGVNVARIAGDMGSDKDSFTISPALNIPTDINGGSGEDVLRGGTVFNKLSGGADNDKIFGGPANDELYGDGGEDYVFGGDGADQMWGGSGVDHLFGEAGGDHVRGDDGEDEIDVGPGNDIADGGDGNDMIVGGAGNDSLSGGTGSDLIFGQGGDDAVIGNDNAASFESGENKLYGDFEPGTPGNDALGHEGNDTMTGSGGRDLMFGSAGDDVMDGRGGNDDINGNTGADDINGGTGDDWIFGDTGVDHLKGDAGIDTVLGGSGNDIMEGGADNDTMHGHDGADTMLGGDGVDTIFGFTGVDTISGNNGNDSLHGGSDADVIYGNAGADSIYGDSGADGIEGNEDNDLVFGGTQNDTIHGNTGDDTLHGDSGLDLIFGDEHNDQIFGGTEVDTIHGNAGADTIHGDAGADVINGDADNDVIYGDADADIIHGNDGADTLRGNTGVDHLYGDAGDDTIFGNEDNDVIYGAAGNDTLSGDAADDLIYGETGNDGITGGTGVDIIHGGDGVDTVAGGDGNDRVLGDAGNDDLTGDAGDDFLDGSADVDTLHGSDGNDTLLAGDGFGGIVYGDAGNDLIYGSDGIDTLRGGTGNDILFAFAAADNIDGEDGDDWVDAGDGNDIVAGSAGNDTLYGAAGNDTINGGLGRDRLFGETGSDTLHGDEEADSLDGGAGADLLYGGLHDDELLGGGGTGDQLFGDAGDDVIRGSNDGADIIEGGAGDDRLYGMGGNDTIMGGLGNDEIDGGQGDDIIEGGGGADVIIGGAQHDTIYGHSASGAGDDNAADRLYGDFGTNLNEAGSGGDQVHGQGGNDLLFGEGGDDLLVVGAGTSNLFDYGSGEGGTPSAFVPPAPTGNPSVQPDPANPRAAATLPTGADDGWFWGELARSASDGGVSGMAALARDAVVAIAASGAVFVAWADTRKGNYDIYLARYLGGSWSMLSGSAENGGISNSAGSSRSPSLAIDATGQPVVAWTEIDADGTSDIRAARFDGSAWGALDNSLGSGGISGTGGARDPQIAIYNSTPVVTWIDSSSGQAQVYARQFTGGTWQALGSAAGTGISVNGGVQQLAAASSGSKLAIAWSGTGTGFSQITVREWNGAAWVVRGGLSEINDNLDGVGNPTMAWQGTNLFVAWQSNQGAVQEIKVRQWNGTNWLARQQVSNTTGHAGTPILSSNGTKTVLAWLDSRAVDPAAFHGRESVYVKVWNGSAFVEELPGEATGGGVARAVEAPHSLAVAVDSAGTIQTAWSEDASRGVNLLHREQPATVRLQGAGESLASILSGSAFGTGSLIKLTAGTHAGAIVGADDAGVVILGADDLGSTVSGLSVNGANVTLRNITVTSPSVNAAGLTLRDDRVTTALAPGAGSVSIVRSHTLGAVNFTAPSGTLEVRDNELAGGAWLATTAGGEILGNEVTGLFTVQTSFSGQIRNNTFSNSGSRAIDYNAPAAFTGNVIQNSSIGVDVLVGHSFGSLGGSNTITGNTTGVRLNQSSVRGQLITGNTTGVTGTGYAGGPDWSNPNRIEQNFVGVSMTGEIAFNVFASNTTAIVASSGQFIRNNVIGRSIETGVSVATNITGVRISFNTLYVTAGRGVNVIGSEVEFTNNVLWADGAGTTGLWLKDSGPSGFWSDYNLLHGTNGAALAHWTMPFTDILDWQQDVFRYDLHSQGSGAVNPNLFRPRVVSVARDDFQPLEMLGNLRITQPLVDAGDARLDPLLNRGYTNLLTNPRFDSALTGWLVSPAGTAAGGFFSAAATDTGFATQTVNLLAAGFTAAQLDGFDLYAVFGGRVRANAEALVDLGTVKITFLDGDGDPISTISQPATLATDRWETTGGRVQVPAGARQIVYRFEASERTAPNNDARLDNTFLYLVPDSVAPDQGSHGLTNVDTAVAQPVLKLRSPDLYRDWEVNKPLLIEWESFANAAEATVKIDLYQDGVHGPAFLVTIHAATVDSGSYLWIPANSGLTAGTHGLRIHLTLNGRPEAYDRSSEPFSIPEATSTYFANDRSAVNDEYTSAIGSNRNTGKTAAAPKPGVAQLLRIYQIGSAQTLLVDTGDYPSFQPLVISGIVGVGDDEGFTFTGPVSAARTALLRYAVAGTAQPVLKLDDADLMTIRRFTTQGGSGGMAVGNGSLSLQASDLKFNASTGIGLSLDVSSTTVSLTNISAQNNGGRGLELYGAVSALTGGTVSGNGGDGLLLWFTGAISVSGLTVQNNAGHGIYTNQNFGLVTSVDVSVIANNGQYGIYGGNLNVTGSTIAGHSVAGILVHSASLISGNVIDGNKDGVFAYDGVVIQNNRFYRQTDHGIRVHGNSQVTGNVIYSNLRGLIMNHGGATVEIKNNLIYGNTDYGVRLNHNGANNLIFTQNTVHSAGNSAISIDPAASGVQLSNNIVRVTAGVGIDVPPGAESGFASNFNLFYTTGFGTVGRWQNSNRTTLTDWRAAAFTDAQSVQQNPQFVSADGVVNSLGYISAANDGRDDDFHLQSPYGSYKGGSSAPALNAATGLPAALTGTWSNDAVFSPGIDRASPSAPFANEPLPNGGYANIGADGNTTSASKSPVTWLLVTSPDGGESAPGLQNLGITWRSHDTAGNVIIELVPSAGAAEVISASTPNDGTHTWNVPAGQAPGAYSIRITRLDMAVADSSNATFTITGPITLYYVNDSTVLAGDWTTAAGNDGNDGLDASRPKASIRAILQAYDLDPGAIILVDNGTYTVTTNIPLTADDSGVTIRGFNDAAQPSRSAVLNRGNTTASAYVFEFAGADNVIIENLTIQGAGYGIYAAAGAGSTGVLIRGNIIQSNLTAGIGVLSSNNNWTISGNTVRGQAGGQQNNGVSLSGPVGTVISGNTVSGNSSTGLYLVGDYSLALENTVSGSVIGIHAVSPWSVIRRNSVSGNVVTGIYADYAGSTGDQVLVDGNTVFNHPGQTGIQLNYATGLNNVAYNNGTGIRITGAAGYAAGNEVRGNVVGIYLSAGAMAQGNRVYSNTTGINIGASSDNARLHNNLIYANTSEGILVTNSGIPLFAEIRNNTIWQITGDAVRAPGTNRGIRLSNNLFHVESGFAISVDSLSQNGFTSDYNLFDLTGTGRAASWGGAIEATWLDWRLDQGFDSHSSSANPLLGDINGLDDILGGTGGADDNFRPLPGSPTLDAGDPNTYYVSEPGPNGGRANIGHTGNSAQALPSGERVVQILSPNGYERVEAGDPQSVPVRTFGFSATLPVARINTGSPSSSGGWLGDDYLSWLRNFGNVSGTIDRSGLAGAPPEDVLRSYTWYSTFTYHLPVPDGTYSVQLYNVPEAFGPGADLADIYVNGVLAADNYDSFVAAGARLKAVALTLPVTATGGSGIDLRFVSVTGTARVNAIQVTMANPAGAASPNVWLEYSANNGGNWQPVTGGQNITPDTSGVAQIPWTPADVTAGRAGLMRASALGGTVTDASDQAFTVVNGGNHFYVNDGSLTGDVFTTATGSNLNDGKSPSTPMARLPAILAAYDFQPGDIIHLDTGTYTLSQNLLLTAEDSGVTIKGPATGSGAIINRNDPAARAIELAGITNVTLENLRVTGADFGVYADASTPSLNLTVRGGAYYSNRNYGIRIDQAASVTVENAQVYGTPGANTTQSYGLNITAGTVVITGNSVHDHVSSGISVTSNAATISSNTVWNSQTGIGFSGAGTVANNTVYNFTSTGIYGSATFGIFKNNTVHHGAVSSYGIDLFNGGSAFGNTVYQAGTGIRIYYGIAADNRIFGMTNQGVVGINATVRGNVIYSSNVGVDLTSNGGDNFIVNNLIYGNTAGAVRTGAGGTALYVIENNTLHQAAGPAVIVQGGTQNVTLRNNIIWADGATATGISVAADSERNFLSDYNAVRLTNGARFGQWQGNNAATWADWTFRTGADRHSHSVNPLFVDVDGADNFMGFSGGVDYGADDNFRVMAGSPTIDAGDPVSMYAGEPSPAGGRVNLGHTGNTALAAPGLPGPVVWMVSPDGHERFETGQSYPAQFHSAGFQPWDVVAQIDVAGDLVTGTWRPDAWNTTPYLSYTTTTVLTLAGTADAAPLGTYQSYTGTYNFQTGLGWQIPVADGTIRLRLHFFDFNSQSNQRVFDVEVNGAVAADNFDIAVAAGNVANKAVVLEIDTVITGGAGLALQLKNVIGAATLSGIEILRANPLAPSGTSTFQLDYQSAAAAAWVRQSASGLTDADRLGYGQFTWTAGAQTTGATARLRVVASTGASGASMDPFLITNAGTAYYVNDGSLTGDEFTTVAGNDFNSGKSPGQPMATLAALLDAYNLDPDDVIYLDTGSHAVWRDINWTSDDSGARLQGPLQGGIALLDRGNATAATVVLRITGADDVSVSRVRITGAEAGIRLQNGADGFRLTYSQVYGNKSVGFGADADSNDAVFIADNTFYGIPGGATTSDDQAYGIQIYNSANASILRNRVYDGSVTGIEINGGSPYYATVSGNTVSNNFIHGIGFYTGGIASDNTVYDNHVHGIVVGGSGGPTFTGNTVYRQLGASSYGIYGGTGAVIANNTVYQNTRGIYSASGAVRDNRIFGNVISGIEAAVSEKITGNFIYSNGTGIDLRSFSPGLEVKNNLIYANTNYGILIAAPGGSSAISTSSIVNNTIDQPVGDAIRITSSSAWFTLVNNIITVGTGNGIFIASSAGNGLAATRNLYFHGGGGGSYVGQRNGVSHATLAAWQAASSLDAQSLFADPLFIDKDGPDNRTGFAAATGDSGKDDNFYLSKSSPAIDRGDSWKGPVTDLFGLTRHDDPGTVNTGTADYFPAVQGASGFAATGNNAFLNSPNSYTFINLANPFPFYGQNYTTVYITSEGYLRMGSITGGVTEANSQAALGTWPIIAPLWDNFTTAQPGGGVFVDTSVAGQTTIRWAAALQSDTSKTANFSVTLYNDGRIRFHYGAGNTGLTPTIGISAGNGVFKLSPNDGSAVMTNANSVEFAATSAGVTDIGAIEFAGSSADAAPPVVTGSTPAVVFTGGSTSAALFHFTLNFSDAINPIDAETAANFELRSSGVNLNFGDADDIITPLDPVYVAGGSNLVLRIPGGPLPAGNYRLTVTGDSVRDQAGNRLDGDNNGSAGGNFVKLFTVTSEATAPRVTGVALSRSTWSSTFRQSLDPAGGLGYRIATGAAQSTVIPYADLDQISIVFNEHVVVDLAQIQLRSSTGALIPLERASMNVATHTLTLTLGQPLTSAHYELALAGATDAWGNALDGEWQNGVSTQSGNGTPGGAFAFAFRLLEGDVSGDGIVNDVDLFAVWQRTTASPYSLLHDLTGDGLINSIDTGIVAGNYLQSLPGAYTLSGGLTIPVPSPLIEIINNPQP